MPTCMSPRRAARLRRDRPGAQRALAGGHGVVQATLRDPDIRLRQRAAEHVGDEAGLFQAVMHSVYSR